MKREFVPESVLQVIARLKEGGYRAFLVGGSVRDLLMGKQPSDFDIATNALPEEVQALFPRAIPVGAAFGTVLIPGTYPPDDGVHVTTLRSDLEYKDSRRPSGVLFTSSIRDDLARRDFTINAMAWDPDDGEFVDPFGGRQDLDGRTIRAVGNPLDRMREDALRTLRAVRFATILEFDIEPKTWTAIELEARRVSRLSAERIRDELMRILAANGVGRGLWMMVELGLFFVVFPELKGADRMLQAKKDAPTLLDHLIQTASNCPADDAVLTLAGLLHDIGKLKTRSVDAGGRVRFHGHAQVGADMAKEVCRRLRLSRRDTERVVSLVRMHMAFSGSLAKKTIRRWMGRYGRQWVQDLVALGRADWGASGWRGDIPDLDAVQRTIDEIIAEEQAFGPGDLAVTGHDIMDVMNWESGPAVGRVLDRLYDLVLETPELNEKMTLLKLVQTRGTEWAEDGT